MGQFRVTEKPGYWDGRSFHQVGTVVESAAEFYSGRLTNRERQGTITEELLHDPSITTHRKKRYNKLQVTLPPALAPDTRLLST